MRVGRRRSREPWRPSTSHGSSVVAGGFSSTIHGSPATDNVKRCRSGSASVPNNHTKATRSPSRSAGTGSVSHAMACPASSERTSKAERTSGSAESYSITSPRRSRA